MRKKKYLKNSTSLDRVMHEFKPTKKQRELLGKHYENALRIAKSFKNSLLYEDEKENIGIAGLIKAIKTFDPNRKGKNGKPSKITTWIYWGIRSEMRNTMKAKQRTIKIKHKDNIEYLTNQVAILPNQFIEGRRNEDGEPTDIFETISENLPVDYNLEWTELLQRVKSQLNKKDRHIFRMLLTPNRVIENYKRYGLKQVPTRVNQALISEIYGYSRERARQRINRIKKAVLQAIKGD